VRNYYVQNFGCRAAQADGASLEHMLEGRGLQPAPTPAKADLVVLNTCTVTAAADEDVRRSISRVHRDNPAARILVTGCYAQRAPEELSRLPGVAWVVGNSHKTKIADILEGSVSHSSAPYHGMIHVGEFNPATPFLAAPVRDASGDRTRPNLKIQDGCSNNCSFCIIPSVRGRGRSMPAEEVLDQVRTLAATYQEIVLTGVNLGRWGRERGFLGGPVRLATLLRRILDETEVARLRLSSVEPMDFSDDLLELMAASPRIAKHVHAPLQSGSDAVLRRMKRRYRARHYEDRIARAFRLMPDAAFGADVMTGFPGETTEEFEATYSLIDRLPLTYLHVFTYSERPGTPAAAMPHVPLAVRKERTHRLRELGARKSLEFRRRMVGRELSAVTLDNGLALTENYLRVEMAAVRPPNQIVTLSIAGISDSGLRESVVLNVLQA
jgi:threonylcarbamoyladenosine tRNA methylthiotransferase MtaB